MKDILSAESKQALVQYRLERSVNSLDIAVTMMILSIVTRK